MTTMKNHNVYYSACGGGFAFCAGAMAMFAFALAACADVADGTEGWMNVDPGRTEVQPQQQIWKADLSQWPEGFEVKRNDGQLSTPMPDFSKPAVEGFRRWQEKAFGKIKWNDPPTYDDDQEYFYPGRDDHRIAYFRYLKQCPMEFMEDIAREFKRLMGKDILSTRWCMSPFKGQYNDALDVTQFANSDVIDIITPQPSYTRRTPGLTISTRLPMASFRHHGKLMVNEFDLRTYGAVHPGETEQRVTYLSQARDPGMWRTIYRKVAAGQVAARMGWWFFDMSGGWFEPEPINADIADSVKTYRELIATPSHAPDPAAPRA